MIGPVFVDTNVLVYRHDISDPIKQSRADDWIALLVHYRLSRLSIQVLQEFYATLTQKLKPRFDVQEAQEIVRELASWQPVTLDLTVLERAWVLQDRYSLSWWDALIVASALRCECEVLLTEDLQHGQVFETVRAIDPFAASDRTPTEILEALES